MNTIVVEDAYVDRLAPASTSRPVWAITCGSYRLFDFLQLLDGPLVVGARRMFAEILARDYADYVGQPDPEQALTVIVNGRLAATVRNFVLLESIISQATESPGRAVAVGAGESRALIVLPTEKLMALAAAQGRTPSEMAQRLMGDSTEVDFETAEGDFYLLGWPHDIVAAHMQSCTENLEYRLLGGGFERLHTEVYVAEESPAQIPASVVFDTTDGPILIDAGAKIGPFSYFRGPVYIGPNSKISEHSSIKDGVSIGHTCKIGGEVEGVIVEPYSNKQHYGFLGHSYLGSWINLGAGTCNSDLKNTYGAVNMTSMVGEHRIATGMQFVGCVIGDYAKTAINTSIFTGKLIGVGSMVYAMATTNVPSFVNYARSIGQLGVLPADVVITTQKRMFGRRRVEQQACDAQLIRDMFAQTEPERPAGITAAQLDF